MQDHAPIGHNMTEIRALAVEKEQLREGGNLFRD
jgi:hypothetical protein